MSGTSKILEACENIRTSIGMSLYRLFLKIQLWQFKRGLQLRKLARWNVESGIRLSIEDAKQEGFDTHVDQLIRAATFRLLKPEIYDRQHDNKEDGTHDESYEKFIEKQRQTYKEHKPEIDKILTTSKDVRFVNKWTSYYFLAENYLNEFRGNSFHKKIDYLNKALAIDPTVKQLTHKDIETKITNAKKDHKAARFELSEREAIKINIGINVISPLIASISSLMIVSGFVYNYIYFDYFGVDVTKYFTRPVAKVW